MSKRPAASTRLAGLGFEFAAAVAGFAFIGYWLGGHWGNAALGLVIGAALGILGGTYNLIRASLTASREQEKQAGKKDSHSAS